MKSLYQLLFQNETLYRSQEVAAIEKIVAEVAASMVAEAQPEPLAEVAKPAPIVTVPAVATPPIQPQLATPTLNHQILILVNEAPAMSPSNTIFLEKVLKAVNLNLEGVDVLNLAGAKQMDFKPLLQNKKVHHFISFGVPFIQINLEIMMNRYDPKQIAGVNFLLAESLDIVQADDKNKRALWMALKKIFLESN
jgi:DNA polymerase III psi subunit